MSVHPTAVIGEPPQHRHAVTSYPPVYPPRIHATARIGALTVVDSGMDRRTVIGARTWLLCQVHIAHDVVVGDDCEIATGTVIAGHCEIGDKVRIGVNATLLPFIKVGDGARVGAGAVVTKNIPAGEVWAGNPARPLSIPCRGCGTQVKPTATFGRCPACTMAPLGIPVTAPPVTEDAA